MPMLCDEQRTISKRPYLPEDPACDATVRCYSIEVVSDLTSMMTKVEVDLESLVIHLNDVDNRSESEEFPSIYPRQNDE